MADSYNKLFGLGTHSPDAALEGWWKLDSTGNASDLSGNNRTATVFGNPSVVAGPTSFLPNALEFDTDAKYARSGDSVVRGLPATHDFSLLFRSNSNNNEATNSAISWQGTDDAVIYPNDGSGFSSLGNGGVRIFWRDIGGTIVNEAGTDLSNVWINMAFVGDSVNSRSVYRNNVLVGSDTTDGSGAGPFDEFLMGRFPGQSLDGRLADVSIFSRALNSNERAEWQDGPEALNTTAPVLASDGTVTSGTWDSQNNGTLNYSTELYQASDDSLVATIAGIDPDFSSDIQPDTDYYVIERASNDGGFDEAEDSQSATTRSNGGVEVKSGSGDIESESSFSGSGSTSRSGSGSIPSEGTFAGTGQSVNSGSGNFESTSELQGAGTTPNVDQDSGSGSFSSVGNINGSGQTTNSGQGSFNSAGSFVGDGSTPNAASSGSGNVESAGVITGGGQAINSGSGSFSSTVSLFGSGTSKRSGFGSLSSAGKFRAVPLNNNSLIIQYYYHLLS